MQVSTIARAVTPTEVPPPTPGAALYRSRGMDILQLPGIRSLSWGMTRPNELAVNAWTDTDAALLTSMLEPVVEGVNLVVMREGKPYAGASAGLMVDMLRAVAALPGVWNIDKRGIGMNGGSVSVKTINQGTIDRLDPLIKDRLDFGKNPKTGGQRWVRLYWKAGIPA